MILHFDSFDAYGGDKAKAVPPFQTMSANLVTGGSQRTGSYAAQLGSQSVDFDLKADYTTPIFMGYACRYETVDTGRQRRFLSVYSDANKANRQFYIAFDTVGIGSFVLYDGLTDAVLARSTYPFPNRLSKYTFMEFSFKVADAGGFVEMKMSGEVVLSFTGDTHRGGPASARLVSIESTSVGSTFLVDDLYICDDTGSELNTYLGDCKTENSALTADDTPLDWTPSTGSNHTTIVGTLAPNDSQNIESSVVGDKDTFSINDISTGIIEPIMAVMVNVRAEQD